MEAIFKKWRSYAAKETGLQIATIGVFSSLKAIRYSGKQSKKASGCPHCHIMCADANRKGQSLKSLTHWQREHLIDFCNGITMQVVDEWVSSL